MLHIPRLARLTCDPRGVGGKVVVLGSAPSGHASPYGQKTEGSAVYGSKAIGCSPHTPQYHRAAELQNFLKEGPPTSKGE